MKCCCLVVFIFCTIDVANGGILSGICLASNGTCGKKGVSCKETYGSEWTYTGKCCNERPCCKFLKAPCFPETCPEGFRLLSDQSMTAHCYKYHEAAPYQRWQDALAFCTGTPGGYLWIPNTVQEADAVKNEFNLLSGDVIWTGANDIDKDGIFTFAIENSPFSFNQLPFGWGKFYDNLAKVYTPYVVRQQTNNTKNVSYIGQYKTILMVMKFVFLLRPPQIRGIGANYPVPIIIATFMYASTHESAQLSIVKDPTN